MYDAERGVLRRFNASGLLIATLGIGPKLDPFSVSDLAIDRSGAIYAADPAGQRVLVFDATAKLSVSPLSNRP